MIEADAKSIECRKAPFDAYNIKVDAALSKMVWSHRGTTEHIDPTDYISEKADEPGAAG